MIVLPTVGAAFLLDLLIASGKYWLHLYVNPVELGPGTILINFQEASFAGYAPYLITGWTPSQSSADCTFTAADPIVWVVQAAGPAQEVYGYFVTDGETGALCWAENRDAGPIVMMNVGDELEVMPRLTLRTDPTAC